MTKTVADCESSGDDNLAILAVITADQFLTKNALKKTPLADSFWLLYKYLKLKL